MVLDVESVAQKALKKLFEDMFGKEDDLRLVINVKELAKLLKINLTAAYQITKSEGFPKIKVGNRIIIPILSLLTWLENESNKS